MLSSKNNCGTYLYFPPLKTADNEVKRIVSTKRNRGFNDKEWKIVYNKKHVELQDGPAEETASCIILYVEKTIRRSRQLC